MSLIIQPSQVDRRKTFYATKVQPYNTVGTVRGHLPPLLMAAFCIKSAVRKGCEDIVVCPEGLMPRRYSVKSVLAAMMKEPLKYKGLFPWDGPKTKQEALFQHLRFRHEQKTGTGLFLAEA